MTLAYFLLSCFHGIRECFIPFSPRKSIAWLSTILLMIVRNTFQIKPIQMVHYKPILGTDSPCKTYRSIFENKNKISKCKKSASFGASVFLVAFDIIPTLSIASLVVTM